MPLLAMSLLYIWVSLVSNGAVGGFAPPTQCRYHCVLLPVWGARHQQFVDLLRSAVASRLCS